MAGTSRGLRLGVGCIRPVVASLDERIEVESGEFDEQHGRVNDLVGNSLIPAWVAARIAFQPPLVRRPVRRLVHLDDMEDLLQLLVAMDQRRVEQSLDRPHAAALGQRYYPA